MAAAALTDATRGAVTIGGPGPAELRAAGRIGLAFRQARPMPRRRIDGNVRPLRDLATLRAGAGRRLCPGHRA